MKVVLTKAKELGKGNEFPFDYLEQLIQHKRRIDNLLVLSHQIINPTTQLGEPNENRLANLLKKYRSIIVPFLLHFFVYCCVAFVECFDNCYAFPFHSKYMSLFF